MLETNYKNLPNELEIKEQWNNKSEILISIACAVYNHEKYLVETLTSFLKQETNFPFEIIIHDDASIDNSSKIIKYFEEKYPTIIKPIYQNKNQYSNSVKPFSNFILPKCEGKYIAKCEGDDYWTDPLKLQKQVDFLEENLDYVVTYHNSKIIDENEKLISDSKLPKEYQRDFSNIELQQGNWILTNTICFRNVIVEFPDEINHVSNGDTFLISLLGQYGKGKYLDNIENAVYRKHSNSIWSSLSEEFKILTSLNTFANLSKYHKRTGNDFISRYFIDKCEKEFNKLNTFKSIDHDHQEFKEKYEITIQKHVDLEIFARHKHLPNLIEILQTRNWLHKYKRYNEVFKNVENRKSVKNPTIAIIIIAWKFKKEILENLIALEKQRNQNFKLIFVNNGADDSEFKELEIYFDIYVKLNKNTGAYLARNIGSLFAQSEILLFLDDDCLPDKNLVSSHIEAFKKYNIIACRGSIYPKTQDSYIPSHYHLGDKVFPMYADIEGNTSYLADAFFKVGGWDDEITFGGGGVDLAIKLTEYDPNPFKQIYSPKPLIFHDYERGLKHLASKNEKQEKSRKRLRKIHKNWDEFRYSYKKYKDESDLVLDKNNLLKNRINKSKKKDNIFISIIIKDIVEINSLKKTLESINSNYYENIEVLVTDDRFRNEFNDIKIIKNLKFFKKEKLNEPEKINKAIKSINGSYVVWINSGDELEKVWVNWVIYELEKSNDFDIF